LFGCSALLCAHDPITTRLTWTLEISRIVYKHCAGCHSYLTTYEQARPWAKAIRDEVASRRMPPWGAVQGIGDFAGDPSLTAPEIDMLIAWVEGGAPEGDPVYLPHRPIPADIRAPAIPQHSRALTVSGTLKLPAAVTLVAIQPRGILEAWAILPDRKIERLIRLSDYRGRAYVLTKPRRFPANTVLRVEGKPATFMLR